MSHPSHGYIPQFSFNLQRPTDYFNVVSQASNQSSNGSQQWAPMAPRSVQHNMPSPSASVRSAISAPVRNLRNRPSYQQPSVASFEDNIDPSLSAVGLHLAPPGHVSEANFNIERSRRDDPWTPLHLTTPSAGDAQTSLHQSSTNYKQFRRGPGSVGSAAAPVSDSGYHSQSVVSTDRTVQRQPCAARSAGRQMNIQAPGMSAPGMVRVLSDQRSQHSHLSSGSGQQASELACPQCSAVKKCRSDYKKHMLRHDKPYMCGEPGCKRNGQGFTTVNDLDRHKKSVHRIGLMKKSYQCASENCRNKEKIWPRLDNFKQHIERMHKSENEADLIQRSSIEPSQPENSVESISIDPIDTMLIGMDHSFPGQNNYRPAVEQDIRTDQEASHWPVELTPTHDPFAFYQSTSRASGGDGSATVAPVQSEIRDKSLSGPTTTCSKPRDAATNAEGARLHSENLKQKEQHCDLQDAPKSKAQQQRQALQKLSRAVSNEMDDSPVDLEQLIVRILASTSATREDTDEGSKNVRAASGDGTQGDRRNKVFLTRSEAIQATQMISNLIKQSPGSAFSQPRRSNHGFAANDKVCSTCNHAVARVCDLKKHMKRHSKPYGCTYPKCHKRFGAKSDWKRHENSQHFQLEAFRCNRESAPGHVCGEHFFRIEAFKTHLEAQHKVESQEEREAEAKRRRIGKNCQQQFWCGFHGDVVALKEKRNAAWDERFDHIAWHFEKEKRGIEDWVCAEENRTKRELLRETDRYVFDEEETPPQMEQGTLPLQQAVGRKRGAPDESAGSRHDKRQRRDMHDDAVQETQRDAPSLTANEIKRYCCNCGDGPSLSCVQAACTMCSHTYCHGCGYDDD